MVVFVAFACGVAAGLLAGALRATRLKRQLNRLRREQRGERRPAAAQRVRAADRQAPVSAGYARGDHLADGL